jgi:hypothetical protein
MPNESRSISVSNAMPVMPVVANTSLLWDSEHALDAARYTTNSRANCAAHDASDRTCDLIALVSAFLRTSNNALALRCQWDGKQDKCHQCDLFHNRLL